VTVDLSAGRELPVTRQCLYVSLREVLSFVGDLPGTDFSRLMIRRDGYQRMAGWCRPAAYPRRFLYPRLTGETAIDQHRPSESDPASSV
jgi:hypothetical protein